MSEFTLRSIVFFEKNMSLPALSVLQVMIDFPGFGRRLGGGLALSVSFNMAKFTTCHINIWAELNQGWQSSEWKKTMLIFADLWTLPVHWFTDCPNSIQEQNEHGLSSRSRCWGSGALDIKLIKPWNMPMPVMAMRVTADMSELL